MLVSRPFPLVSLERNDFKQKSSYFNDPLTSKVPLTTPPHLIHSHSSFPISLSSHSALPHLPDPPHPQVSSTYPTFSVPKPPTMNLPPPVHDTSDQDDEDDMATAMGFSSFGTQPQAHPAKRKKYNHVTEAGEDSATGGNTLPLGIPRARTTIDYGMEGRGETSVRRNEEEEGQEGGLLERQDKELEEDQTLEGERGMDAETSMLLKRQTELLRRINESGLSTPNPATETTHAGNNNYYNTGASHPEADTIIRQRNSKDDANTAADEMMLGEELGTARPRPRVGAKDGFEGHTWNEWRKGVRDERGDMAFYDASFVEDPWRGLRTRGGGGEGG